MIRIERARDSYARGDLRRVDQDGRRAGWHDALASSTARSARGASPEVLADEGVSGAGASA